MDTTLDRARLTAFVDDVGEVGFARETVRTYLDALTGRVAALTDTLETGDRAGTTAVAHTLASTSALLGAVALAAVCRDLEHAAPPADATADTARRLHATADDTRRELTAWLIGR